MRQCFPQMCSTEASSGTRRLAHCSRLSGLRPEMAGSPDTLSLPGSFFTRKEREQTGYLDRLFFSQVEYCDNLIFKRRVALDNLGERISTASICVASSTPCSTLRRSNPVSPL